MTPDEIEQAIRDNEIDVNTQDSSGCTALTWYAHMNLTDKVNSFKSSLTYKHSDEYII